MVVDDPGGRNIVGKGSCAGGSALSVIIPCHNEEGTIGKTVDSLLRQTRLPKRIILVDDGSTDATWSTIDSLQRASGPVRINAVRSSVNMMRAGAINLGLPLADTEIVVMMDADTILEPHALERAASIIEADRTVGLVTSTSGVREGHGLLYRLQKLEYANITANRLATKNNVLICHGLFSAGRTEVVRRAGGLSPDMILEDYDLTVKVKLLGYRAVFSPRIKAYTAVPHTLRALLRQRFRWFLGGLDVVTKFGWTPATRGDILSHALFLAFAATIGGTILLRGPGLAGPWTWNPYMAFPIAIALICWTINLFCLRFVENRSRLDMMLRVLILPELLYAVLLSFVQWYAYLTKAFVKTRGW